MLTTTRITYTQLDMGEMDSHLPFIELFTQTVEGQEADELINWFAENGVQPVVGAICRGTRIDSITEEICNA